MRSNDMGFVWLAVALVVLLGFTMFGALYTSSQDNVTFIVSEKERVVTADDSYYVVFTDGEVFSNKDSLVFRKFNSSDLQAEMRDGSYCQATVAGWRIPLFSKYRNVIDVECSESG